MSKVKKFLDEATKIYSQELFKDVTTWEDAHRAYCGEILAQIIEIAKMLQKEHNG